MYYTIAQLHDEIDAVCPIYGVDTHGNIQHKPEATTLQKQAAQEMMDKWLALPEDQRLPPIGWRPE